MAYANAAASTYANEAKASIDALFAVNAFFKVVTYKHNSKSIANTAA